jgi:cellulose synthase/poly-beta-1,6-N-acetylglucosamine synthase-like glycosyltransferase
MDVGMLSVVETMIEIGIFLLLLASLPYLIYLVGILYGPKQPELFPLSEYPPVSIVISAYNEEKNVPTRIKNLADCNYPDAEIMFIDDCSTDRTFELAKTYLDKYGFNYHLTQNNQRLGTSLSYNIGIRNAKNDVVVVTDADTIFKPDALHRIVTRLMSDDMIGAVTGDLQPYQSPGQTTEMEAEYRSVYGKMCEWESAEDSTFNFNGALMAFKKSAVVHIDDKKGADDANLAFAAIRNGYRAVYESEAVVYETIPVSFKVQFRQKIRRATGILNSMIANRDLLWSDRLFSHFFFYRMWMYLVSPVLFFIGIFCDPVLFVLAGVSAILSFSRSFILNQFYLLIGLLRFRTDVKTWESTSSMDGES